LRPQRRARGTALPTLCVNPLETLAIYKRDDIEKGSIPHRKGGVKTLFSNGVNGARVAMLSSVLNSERAIKVMIERPVVENSF